MSNSSDIGISTEEWLAELNRLDGGQEEDAFNALTTDQLCEMFGHGRRWICTRLREAMKRGLIRCVQKKDMDITGKPCWKPAYLLVKKAKGKSRGT